ncbi:MAG: hypothetical protein SGPRY_012638, partial [Prymnesium sp.]
MVQTQQEHRTIAQRKSASQIRHGPFSCVLLEVSSAAFSSRQAGVPVTCPDDIALH